uniref:Transcription factor bHLH113 isoform X1 n=1 Tax=Elaeis guineensis var. tenera TaxID=51953 RepID=A0A8N4F023_ELAGV|nr:transcription factor bHLH113 isoform X1 [Elaeis guineensis]
MEERGEEMEEGSLIEMLGCLGEEEGYLFGPPSSIASTSTTAYMLYFGGHGEDAVPFHGVAQKSSDSSLSSLSSSPSSTTTAAVTSSKSSKKKFEISGGGGRRTTTASNPITNTSVTSKKPKTGGSTSDGASIKVRKEKLGERIIALQQLVSPFGKSDTASVLHEALGYIRFLHEQVQVSLHLSLTLSLSHYYSSHLLLLAPVVLCQVLSSPYLQRLPSSTHLHEGKGVETRTNDLRSRGLCLVPVSCTEHVAKTNGADLWSPAMGCSNSSSSSSPTKR